jgi:transposase
MDHASLGLTQRFSRVSRSHGRLVFHVERERTTTYQNKTIVGVRTFYPSTSGYSWDHLDEISIEELQHALNNVEGNKPTQRLTAAIAYKNGVTQTELAEWYGVGRRTIYSWLKRLETEPLEQAVQDDHRSGRPRKLTEEQQKQLEQTLHQPPTEAGIDAPAWTPALLDEFLEETFDVDYSIPSCRRLMKEAGLSYQKPRRTAAEAEPDDRDGFH